MNNSTKHADLIKAHKDGAEIQYYSTIYEEWEDVADPIFANDTKYRIKPYNSIIDALKQLIEYFDCVDLTAATHDIEGSNYGLCDIVKTFIYTNLSYRDLGLKITRSTSRLYHFNNNQERLDAIKSRLAELTQTIYNVGDKVFDTRYGWGEVVQCTNGTYTIHVKFINSDTHATYTKDGKFDVTTLVPTLSFTEYRFDGFSQDRKYAKQPHELDSIPEGTPIYVRSDMKNAEWYLRYYAGKHIKGCPVCYMSQKKEGKVSHWSLYSIDLPLN